ncbi:MAG: hypothetical protein ACRDMZ_13530, partial [Solirubrobacteraceae bacterium]
DALDAELEAIDAEARALRDAASLYQVELYRATRALIGGDAAGSEALARNAFDTSQRLDFDGGPLAFATQSLMVRFEQGRIAEAIEPLARDAESRPDPAARCTLAWARAEAGDTDGAQHALAAWSGDGLDEVADFPMAVANAFVLARAAFLVGTRDLAPGLERILSPVAERVAVRGSATAHGPVDHALGLLAALRRDADTAERLLVRAAGFAQRMGAPLWLARIDADRSRIHDVTRR